MFSFEMFEAEAQAAAGDHGSILIHDATYRLFGYHGFLHGHAAFSFDHMFGFYARAVTRSVGVG